MTKPWRSPFPMRGSARPSNVRPVGPLRRVLISSIRDRTGLILADGLLGRFGQGLRTAAGARRRSDAAGFDPLSRARQDARLVPVLAEGVRGDGGLVRQGRFRQPRTAHFGVALKVGTGLFGLGPGILG